MDKTIISTPQKLTYANVEQFIDIASPIFNCEGKKIPNIVFNTSTTIKLDLIGSLLIFKFYEYTVHKKCFFKPDSVIKGYVKAELEKRQIKNLVDNFINYEKPQYNRLKYSEQDKLFISPILLDRNSLADEVSRAGVKICNYYHDKEDVQFLVLTSMGEIALNFKAHAVEDTTSILSVTGTKDEFEIACVDTGVGIISSLRESYKQKGLSYSSDMLFKKSLEKGVTSKDNNSGHMGYGLWLLKELVLSAKGEMRLYSQGYGVICHNGRIRFTKTSMWKGTIAYIKLPLSQSNILKDKMEAMRPLNMNIRIRKI